MILVQETIDKFGYHPDELSRCSGKKVVVNCEICNQERILSKHKTLKRNGETPCKKCTLSLNGQRIKDSHLDNVAHFIPQNSLLRFIRYIEHRPDKSGRLSIINLYECQCGRIIEKVQNGVLSGITKTCGKCGKYAKWEYKIDVGHKIGKLTVIERLSGESYFKSMWLCKCECGNTLIKKTSMLCKAFRNKSDTDCGKCGIKIYPGQKIGKLTVIEQTLSNTYSYAKWLCKCDCGENVLRWTSNLWRAIDENRYSGCDFCNKIFTANNMCDNPFPYNGYKFRSSWEFVLACILEKLNEPFEYEKEMFPLLINNVECYYLPDFYIKKQDLWIEVKGPRSAGLDKFDEFSKQYNAVMLKQEEIFAMIPFTSKEWAQLVARKNLTPEKVHKLAITIKHNFDIETFRTRLNENRNKGGN